MHCHRLIVLLNPDLEPHHESTSDPGSPTNLISTNSDNLNLQRTSNNIYNLYGESETNSGLVSSSLYAANNSQALLGDVSPDQDLNSIISRLRAHHFDSQTKWRLYQPFTAHPEGPILVQHNPHILVYNAMTTESESEEDFNNWYKDEHIPMLSRTPSWISSRRYILLACSDNAPRYLALHSWGSRTVFDSPAYKSSVDTPWRTRVIGKLVERERIVFDYVDDLRAQEQANNVISTILASD